MGRGFDPRWGHHHDDASPRIAYSNPVARTSAMHLHLNLNQANPEPQAVLQLIY